MATQILPHARPSAPAVLAYLATGHSNADAAAHFGIHERSVRRIKQRAGERATSHTSHYDTRRSSDRSIADFDPDRNPVALRSLDPAGSAPAAPGARVFPPTADDVAGDHTMWRCPASGELLPIVPGTRRHDWERERRETHARHVARVTSTRAEPVLVMSPSPDRTGQQPFTAWESERTGPDSSPGDDLVTGPDRTAAELRGTREEPRKGAQPAGIVRDYLRHQADEVRRDGLLVLGWRWIDERDMIGPFPTRGLLAALAGLALAVLGVLG
ncbi:MAG TPA: hypothetical protein VLA19_06630 [Herpetosiphonaceae bacterium]|nr:hypothetical protein [Herpetosiphonaceae bacterium]